MSEIDFLIVTDDFVLVLEVKGGRLRRRVGVWTFTDRYGEHFNKREGPFDQARTAMFALEERLLQRLPRLDVGFGYLVVTPDQDLAEDVEWDGQLLAGPTAMSVRGLERACEASRRYWLDKRRQRPSGGAYKELLQVLRPDFDRVPPLSGRIHALEADYVRFADRQYELLLVAERNPRIICLGGAGSGKTLLAVETARRAAQTGASVLVTCRSEPLAQLLSSALVGTGVLCLPFSALDGAGAADVLVVDEAQDLMDLQSYARLDELVAGGWETGRWRLFCDPNNQANVDGRFDRTVLDELMAQASLVELPFNCRNTSTIVHQTQLVTGADIGVARAGEGPAVDYQQCADDASTARLLDAHLKRLRQAEVDLRDVTVVTVRDTAAESAVTASKAYRTGRLVDDATWHGGAAQAARLLTAADVKGLEAPHVCVVDVEDTQAPTAQARLYVGMTRARISLWLGLHPPAWRQLAEGPSTGAPT